MPGEGVVGQLLRGAGRPGGAAELSADGAAEHAGEHVIGVGQDAGVGRGGGGAEVELVGIEVHRGGGAIVDDGPDGNLKRGGDLGACGAGHGAVGGDIVRGDEGLAVDQQRLEAVGRRGGQGGGVLRQQGTVADDGGGVGAVGGLQALEQIVTPEIGRGGAAVEVAGESARVDVAAGVVGRAADGGGDRHAG